MKKILEYVFCYCIMVISNYVKNFSNKPYFICECLNHHIAGKGGSYEERKFKQQEA